MTDLAAVVVVTVTLVLASPATAVRDHSRARIALPSRLASGLQMPEDPGRWSDDDLLVFLHAAGEEGPGDWILGDACLRRARLFIGNDSGLMHIAAAAGTPTLGLFGPSDERRYGPWGDKAVAVRGPRTFEQFLAIDPDLSQAIRHMSDLPVATVVRAAKALLARTEPEAEISPQEAVVEATIADGAAGAEVAPPAEIVAEESAPEVETSVLGAVSPEQQAVEEAIAEERTPKRKAKRSAG